MRLSALFARLCAFGAAALCAVFAAQWAVSEVEERSVFAVQERLVDEGYAWATVLGDGLQVILEGEAPTEVVRFRAISAAGGMVDASRVIDNLTVADAAQIAPPSFAIEILRNDAGVSLIGLIPATTDRADLTRRIASSAADQPVTDLLEVGDYPAPDNWEAAVRYGLRALAVLPNAKISINADRVNLSAIADSPADKRQLETALARNPPAGVRLAIDIRAPRPVIAPFTTRFLLDEAGARFDACAVDTEAALAALTQAATAAGFTAAPPCTFALGAPSRDWGSAVADAINALAQLGGGTVTISDTDVTLVALLGTEARAFNRVVGRLQNSLPAGFALTAELPLPPSETAVLAPEFTVTLSPEGDVQLRGEVADARANAIIENFALAEFSLANITMGTRIAEGLPTGWTLRLLAGIAALAELSNGVAVVEETTLSVSGDTGNPDASAAIARLLIDKLGQTAEFAIDVTYVEELDPIASLPTPEECLARIIAATEGRKITFDPGSADLTRETQPVVDDIAQILRDCGDLPIRVAGYTDSQGREVMNQQLSQDRADAVLTALRARRVPVGTFESIGFGEENPIADNETEEGREANRRIEFSLIDPEADGAEESRAEEGVAPETDAEGSPSEDEPEAPTEAAASPPQTDDAPPADPTAEPADAATQESSP